MHADLAPILVIGILVALAAFTALALLVRRDLAPVGSWGGVLDGGGRWFLGAALGLGVIAFSIKLAILATLASFPTQTIAPLIEPRAQVVEDVSAPPPASPQPPTAPTWRGLPALVPAPVDNPPNAARLELGRRLFHDTKLSQDGSLSCASCHDVTKGAGHDGRATALGINGQIGSRNTPTVYNAAYQARLFWDGRAASLEEQALGPILNPLEMGLASLELMEQRLVADPTYPPAFAAAFGSAAITANHVAQALATFERSLVTNDSPYDRFVAGDERALSPGQRRGMWLFQDLGCATCHSGPNFSGASLVGPKNPYAVLRTSRLPADQRGTLAADKGRAASQSAEGVWRVPSLRNVALTAPYFHNGSVSSLEQAVRVMAQAQLGAKVEGMAHEDLWWSAEQSRLGRYVGKTLSRRDVDDLAAFLRSLTSDTLARRAAL